MLSKTYSTRPRRDAQDVLILVLMEYALEVWRQLTQYAAKGGLNPCFNGICSRRPEKIMNIYVLRPGLNPCFNGICSRRKDKASFERYAFPS